MLENDLTVEQIYELPRVVMPDGQKIKAISFEVFNSKCNDLSKKSNKIYTDTGMSPRLCTIFDKFYNKYLDPEKFYLFFDCGCSDGRTVEHAQKKPNIAASGCELSQGWIEYASSRGRDVYYADVNDLGSFGKRKFDIILCSKVLGLTKNFRQSLLNLCSLLNPDGYIILLFGFIKRSNTNHYCLIEHPDIVLNWIKNYKEFENMEVLETIYTEQYGALLAQDEVIILLHKRRYNAN